MTGVMEGVISTAAADTVTTTINEGTIIDASANDVNANVKVEPMQPNSGTIMTGDSGTGTSTATTTQIVDGTG